MICHFAAGIIIDIHFYISQYDRLHKQWFDPEAWNTGQIYQKHEFSLLNLVPSNLNITLATQVPKDVFLVALG